MPLTIEQLQSLIEQNKAKLADLDAQGTEHMSKTGVKWCKQVTRETLKRLRQQLRELQAWEPKLPERKRVMPITAKRELVRIEPASAHHMQTAESDLYDGQGRFATFLIREDAQSFADALECLKAFTEYVAEPEDDTRELYRLHTLAQKIVRRFENRLKGGCV